MQLEIPHFQISMAEYDSLKRKAEKASLLLYHIDLHFFLLLLGGTEEEADRDRD